jgi:hypothetical protein
LDRVFAGSIRQKEVVAGQGANASISKGAAYDRDPGSHRLKDFRLDAAADAHRNNQGRRAGKAFANVRYVCF